MRKRKILLPLCLAVMSAAGSAASAAEENLIDAAVETSVALITMDQSDVHWIRLEEAAEERTAAYNEAGSNIDLIWLPPAAKDNDLQIEKIETAIEDGVSYIIIAANDKTSCNGALQDALDAGIRIIYVDSPAELEAEATFATDSFAGGVQAGEYMLQALTEDGLLEGTIGIVDVQEGVESCQKRCDGFISVFENTGFEIGEREYSDGLPSRALELAEKLIEDGAVAIYSTNEGSTNGTAAAVAEAANKGKTVYCVGWDNSDANIMHIEGGELLAFMAQYPDVMGMDAIDAVVALECGEDLGGETVNTGVSTVTLANIDDFK